MAKDLRVRGKFGITHATGTTDTRLSPLHTDFDDLEETEKGLYTHSTTKRTNYEGDLTATYGRVLAEKHMLNAVAGFNFNATKRTANGYKANGFTDDQFALRRSRTAIPRAASRPTPRVRRVPRAST